ncbi:hypothetical protein C8Q77DRAFT_1087920 [Trametes polyzona]|nr:hypothetical protein C8Q77DRAFT_1087920 [Trametes polyzona]
MPYNEDAQPNEVRHARKGVARVPAIRSSHTIGRPSRGRALGPHRGRGFYHGRGWGSGSTTAVPQRQDSGRFADAHRGTPSDPHTGHSKPFLNSRGSTPDSTRRRHPYLKQGWKKPTESEIDGKPSTSGIVIQDDQEPLLAVKHLDPPVQSPNTRETWPIPSTIADLGKRVETSCKNIYNTPEVVPERGEQPHTSTSRPLWSFDPRQPSLSISLVRTFHSITPPTAAHDRATSHGGPLRVAPTKSTGMSPSVGSMSSELDNALCDIGPKPDTSPSTSLSTHVSRAATPSTPVVPPSSPPKPSEKNSEPEVVQFLSPEHVDGGDSDDPSPQPAVRWGCWSALSCPPKIRSGVLVLGDPADSPPAVCTNDGHVTPAPSPMLPYGARDSSSSVRADAGSSSAAAFSESDDTSLRDLPQHEGTIQLRRDIQDKPRRLFVLPDGGVLSVTMRGCFDLVQSNQELRSATLRATSALDAGRQVVDDVCMLVGPEASVFVLGHARHSQQISLVGVEGRKAKELGCFDRPVQGDKNRGVSAVCSMLQPGMFATGGYDHVVHLWSTSDSDRPAPSEPLGIKHTSMVQTLLAIRDTSRKLVTGGADCALNIFDLPSERVVNTLKLSNSVYHVHPAPSEFCTLLELAHRELQFEIRDYRLVPTTPVVRFGYPSAKVHGRYVRGAVSSTTFASGGSEKDGCVRLWDLRNTSQVMKEVPCLSGRKVTQVVFGDGRLVACSEDHHLVLLNSFGDPIEL